MSFDWSIGPLVSWMKAFGLPLESCRENVRATNSFKRIKKIMVHGIALLAFLVNVETKLYYLGMLFIYISKGRDVEALNLGINTTTSLWNLVIGHVNHAFGACGTHLGLLGWTLVHWQSFIRILHRIEEEFKLSLSDYRQIRHISLIGVAFLILVNKKKICCLNQKFEQK